MKQQMAFDQDELLEIIGGILRLLIMLLFNVVIDR